MQRRAVCALGLTLALATGCGDGDFTPPARDDVVRAEEVRVSALIERAERSGFSDRPGRCDVRVLGMREGSTYVWADCSWHPGHPAGTSGPRRVDGTRVIAPGDGALYSSSIRRDYPSDMADAILEDPHDLRPRLP